MGAVDLHPGPGAADGGVGEGQFHRICRGDGFGSLGNLRCLSRLGKDGGCLVRRGAAGEADNGQAQNQGHRFLIWKTHKLYLLFDTLSWERVTRRSRVGCGAARRTNLVPPLIHRRGGLPSPKGRFWIYSRSPSLGSAGSPLDISRLPLRQRMASSSCFSFAASFSRTWYSRL